jgi:hypothetical protein
MRNSSNALRLQRFVNPGDDWLHMVQARKSWREAVRDALVSGSVASIASTAALALFGTKEIGDPAAPLNGPSQWVWGRHAKYRDGFTLNHTVVGYAVHHLASIFWAVLYEKARRGPVLRDAAITSAVASLVDFKLTPPRLHPGFEKRLSRPALAGVYAAFALGLAAGALWAAQRTRPPP